MRVQGMLIPSALNFVIKHRSLLPSTGSVLDLGDQLLYSREHASHLLPSLADQLNNLTLSDYDCVSAIYAHLGLSERICIDYSDKADIRVNLNYTSLSIPGIDARFDVVTNQGFSEHVFNQWAVFECIHYACKPQGLMFHVLPCQGWADGEGWGHGFFQYQPNFFRHLAAANQYELIDLQLSPFSPNDQIYDFNSEFYPAVANPHLLQPHQLKHLGLGAAQFVSLLALFRMPEIKKQFQLPHE